MTEPRPELIHLFQWHDAKTHERITAHAQVRHAVAHIADFLDRIVPDGEAKTEMVKKLREVMFWANHGLAVTPEAEDAALMPTEDNITAERPGAELVTTEAADEPAGAVA